MSVTGESSETFGSGCEYESLVSNPWLVKQCLNPKSDIMGLENVLLVIEFSLTAFVEYCDFV